MELTKYAHSCALIIKDGQRLLLDPGGLTELPDDLGKIDVLVITHNHFDHLDKEKVSSYIAANPDIMIFASPEAAGDITGVKATIPETDIDYPAGAFTLKFYGGQHAMIHKTIPVIGNFGVCVNGAIYYPGDSYAPGPEGTEILLVPLNAPWSKVSEGIDFTVKQKAKLVIPTHDGLLGDAGKNTYDQYITSAAEQAGGTFKRLKPGESVTI